MSYQLSVMRYESAAADELVEVDVRRGGFVFRISHFVSRISYLIFHISYLIFHISYLVFHISYLAFLISYFVFHLSHFKRISYFHMRRTCHVSRERHIRSYFIFRISYFVFRISYFSPLHTSLFLLIRQNARIVHYSYYLCIKLQGMSNWILIFIVQLNRTGLFA